MIQWVFVFTILVVEICILLLLILPLPVIMKRAIMHLMTTVWDMKEPRRALYGCFFVVVVLFVDTMRSIWSVTHRHEDEALPQTTLISLFRQQRNAYLTGFTLLLLLVLYRMQSLLHDLFTAEAKSGVVVSQASNQSKEYTRISDELETTKKHLADALAKSKTNASEDAKSGALMKQVSNQATEYSRVVDENKRLSREVEQLRDQLTKKGSESKKKD